MADIIPVRPRKQRVIAAPNDPRPTIRLCAGEIGRIVDEAEAALIKAERGLFQRDNKIVVVRCVPVTAAGLNGQETIVERIFERGDHALLEDMSKAAYFVKYDARCGADVAANPTLAIVKTLQQRTGELRFPILSGVINAPTLRADGSILDEPGFDAATGLLFDPLGSTSRPFLSARRAPTRRRPMTCSARCSRTFRSSNPTTNRSPIP